MIKKCLVLCLLPLAVSCAVAASKDPAAPPAGAQIVEAGFPEAGTKWVARISQTGSGTTTSFTYTVLGEGTYDGKPVYRVSAGNDILVYDKATGNSVADLHMGKESRAYSPHNGFFSWPLYVGKSWTASYTYHDRASGTTIDPLRFEYHVEAFEEVTVPAGTWKAFRIEAEIPEQTAFSTFWYAPDGRDDNWTPAGSNQEPLRNH